METIDEMIAPLLENLKTGDYEGKMKIRKLPEYIFNKINELFDEDCGGMTVEEEKELLEYIKINLPKIDMVDYVEIWMEMRAELREDGDIA